MELGLGMGCATREFLRIIPTNTTTVIIADSPYVCPLTLRTIVPPSTNELPLMTPVLPSIMAQRNALNPKPEFLKGMGLLLDGGRPNQD